MKLDEFSQEHLKKKIYDSIEKKIFPQSKILVDRDGYGGLTLPSKLQEDYWKLTKIIKEKFESS